MSWSSLVEILGLGFTETHQNTRGEEDMAVLGRIQARLKLQQSSTTTSSCSSPLQDHTFHTTNGDQYSKEGCQDGVLDCGNFLPDPIQCSMLEEDSFLGLFNSGILRTSSSPIEVGVAKQGFQQEQVLSPGMAREVNIPSTTMTSKSNGYNKRKVYDAEASVECIANKRMKGDCDVKEVNPKQETHHAATTVTMKKKISSSKNDDNSSSSSKSASKASEHVQKTDYIHVRARRGQATDSHSLAERVRREKISERMKYLQDLVPACNKITGKAGMLDEIINYVQSLQRQVEFLSMKLATVNPPYDFNLNAFMATGNENISTYGSCHVSATGVSSNISDTSSLSNLMQLHHSLASNSRLSIPVDISHAAIGAPLPDASRNTSLGVLSAPYAWETEVQDVQFCQIKAPFQEASYLGEDMIPYNICMTS